MKTRFERYKNEHRAQNVLSWIFAGLLGLSAVLFVVFARIRRRSVHGADAYGGRYDLL